MLGLAAGLSSAYSNRVGWEISESKEHQWGQSEVQFLTLTLRNTARKKK